MSDLFQIPIGDSDSGVSHPFARFGLEENPFPATGVDSGVLYTQHMTSELKRIQRWIDQAGQATRADVEVAAPVPPLAIFGSLGVGKTHLLNYLENGLRRSSDTPTLRKGLADEGMTKLVLADLFLRYLPLSDDDGEPGAGLLRRLVKAARDDEAVGMRMRKTLRPGSPVKVPFFAAVNQEDAATTWLSRWLRREYTTPAQRSKLGVAGVLQSEGEAVRAVADLMRMARAAGMVRAWFVMIDQLEELWRPNVITPTRRARFLTDLRHLVDQAHEGAPIPVLLAWNTTVETERTAGPPDVRERMEKDYRALWQRLGEPVDLPALRSEDVWPFAERYLREHGVTQEAKGGRRVLYNTLRKHADALTRELVTAHGPMGLAPRKVLAAWRARAEALAAAPA